MAKTWLITGSARGLGRELSDAVLASGDNLVATARRPEQLAGLVERYGDRVRAVALDVTDAEAASAAVQVALNTFGGLDVVVNNAGNANSAPIEETPIEEFRQQIETNLFGVINVTKAALPTFRNRRAGHFLQFSSVGGRVGGSPGLAAYQAAKFAVEGFSEVLNNEVKPFGVKVTIVEPGAFRTDWGGASMALAEVGEDYRETVGRVQEYRRETADKHPGDPTRAAKILVDIANLAEPPLRLLLGSDAVQLAERSSMMRAQEAANWAEVSRSSDFADATDFQDSASAKIFAPKAN